MRFTYAALLSVLICLAPSAASARDRTPSGSFLKYRASTVAELVHQVSRDPVVKARYAHHFMIRPDKVVSYLAALKLVTLKSPVRVRSYYISPGGVCAKAKLLPKGTAVFASGGIPVLSWSCGNPLRAATPAKATRRPDQAKAPAGDTIRPPMKGATDDQLPVETKVLGQPAEATGGAPVAAPEVFAQAEAAPAPLPEPMVVAQAAPLAGPSAVAGAMPAAAAASTSGVWALAGLSGLFGAVAAFGGGTDHTGQSPPPGPKPSFVVVPEPSGVSMAAASLPTVLGVAGIRRFRRRSRGR